MACPTRLASSLSSFVAAVALATPLAAQCGLDWLPGSGARGPHGEVFAILVLPNGDVVAGGSFVVADSAVANNIARWDGMAWQPLGTGVGGVVHALARMPNGDLVAGGEFTTAGGQPANRIALWNGSSWAPLGPGFDSWVRTLLVLPNGDLVAGGGFHHAGATTTNLVAQWNGVSWSPLGSGFGSYEVRSLARMPNGDIIAGGSMFHSLSRWNGVSWNPVPGLDSASSATPSTVFKVAVHPSGDLVATGLLFMNGVPTGVVRWNGVAMQSLNPPVADAQALIARANGDIWIRVGSASAPNVFRWDGTGWTWVSPGPVQVFAFAEDGSGRLLVGADPWSPIEGAVARFDGVNWQTLGEPTPPNVHAMVRMQNGDIVIGGSFASFRGVAANNLARWNGSVWSPLGLGVDGSVSALAAAPNGDLVVSGSFDNAGGAPANRVARWNGQSWSTLGGGLAIEAETLAAGANGEVLALGLSHDLHRFDGLAWSTLTVPLGPTSAVVSLPNGTFAIGGLFFYGSSGVAIVNGGTITPLPGGPAQVWHLLADSRGGLVASGTGTRRWDGTTWTALQTPYHTGLGELPNGELILSGPFLSLGGGAASSLYRMRNGAWESFGEVRTFTQPFEYTEVVIANGHGDLFVAGSVQSAGNVASLGLAQGRPTCPATASVFGAGCTGGAGPVTLVANNEPWVGTTFTATASGMTASSLSVQLLGSAAPALPLPGGAPGCSLFVAPILMDLLLPSAGIATSAWAVPALPSLAGLQVRLQVVGIELGAAGIVRLTSTNALELTIGML